MDPNERRYEELLSLAIDGACSDAEREEFSRLEQDNPHLALQFVEAVFAHTLLQWKYDDISECMSLEQAAQADDKVRRPLAIRPERYLVREMWAVAAAIVTVAACITLWHFAGVGSAANLAIADIVAPSGVVWDSGSNALQDCSLVTPGRLQNSAGSFTLQFRSGATVSIAGPTSLDIKSAMLVCLERGQATARVPEASKGFAIKTPVAKVVDQGTEFGVAARDDGKTDVVVFEGKVDIGETGRGARETTRLAVGEAARIDGQGSIDHIMQIGRDPITGRWWTIDRPAPEDAVIKVARDNIPPNNGTKYFCYQIMYQGLADDVLAYVDHPHQWNGLTKRGLPKFLRGADYVKTFNDYRYINEFEMVVELSRPANLYIFFDNRVPAPDWLESQFEDTGIEIGLDEGPWPDLPVPRPKWAPERSLGVGGGVSIDTVFSVWRRRCLDATPITLGPVGIKNNPSGRAMYGIAATPLDDSQLVEKKGDLPAPK
jgi:ferric-dicitrate binding protein FerR (iron transport regulator)